MKWLRARLRGWLCPELESFDKAIETAKQKIHKEACEDVEVLLKLNRRIVERREAESGEFFFKFPAKRQVAVKDALKLLFDYFGVELKLEKAEDGEFVPRIHLTKDWTSKEETHGK